MKGMSSNPFVVRKTTRDPALVSTALMPSVVPTTTKVTSSAARPAASRAETTVPTGSSGRDGTLARDHLPLSSSTATRSVNVPPVSIPTRIPIRSRL
jgi:hypothetical protein